MAFNGFCPKLEDFEACIKNIKLRNTIGTSTDRELSLYPGQNKVIKCYLAHIAGVNADSYIREDGSIKKISRLEAKHLFPHGTVNDWDNTEKIYSVDYELESDEIEILRAHSIRLLDPLNYFVTPQTKNCEHKIKDFKKNIGEYKPLINLVINERKKLYPTEFNDFLIRSKYQTDNSIGGGIIELNYDIKSIYATSRTTQPKSSNRGAKRTAVPIKLIPNDEADFIKEFQKKGRAEIKITYNDGKVENKPWNHKNLSSSSGVITNIRSKPWYRKSKEKIKEIVCEVK